MKFDPTENLYGLDMTRNDNRLKWNFREFIINMITLSNDAKTQVEVIGVGVDTYYVRNVEDFLQNNLLTNRLVFQLNQLDEFLIERSGDRMPDFWNDALLSSHPDWKQVRSMAKGMLAEMGYSNLTIKIDRSIKHTTSDKGMPLTIESTKTYLKWK